MQTFGVGTVHRPMALPLDSLLVSLPAPAPAPPPFYLAGKSDGVKWFWAALGRTMPDWTDRKMMLERWEANHCAV